MSFHQFRRSFWPRPNLLNRIWSYQDRNPLPPKLNWHLRRLLNYYRRIDLKRKAKKHDFIFGSDNSLREVPRLYIIKKDEPASLSKMQTCKRFGRIHEISESLLSTNGSWVPQQLSDYYGKGISIEEISLRVRGYLSAYTATNERIYFERAEQACNYLLEKRIFKDGHILLQGHMTIDLPYPFAGEALLQMWKITSRTDFLEAAENIGDRLIEYQIAGSVNHAVVPVQFLGQLYQITGEKKYLDNCIKRLMNRAVCMQLPYGGWLGHESWIWYHALILRSLIIGYVSLPNTLEFYAKRDKIACSIIAAINRMILCQQEDGSFAIRPPEPICETTHDQLYLEQKAIYSLAGGFQKVMDNKTIYGSWNGYVIDALVTAYELLDAKEIIPYLNKYAKNIVQSDYVWRLEFDTLGAGRLLEYAHKLIPEKKDGWLNILTD